MPKQSGTADLIVKGAIALVTVAFFIGAYLQFQVSFWLALIAALSVYIMLLMVHALMRRSERETDLVHEVNRLEDEVARLQVAPTPSYRSAPGSRARICAAIARRIARPIGAARAAGIRESARCATPRLRQRMPRHRAPDRRRIAAHLPQRSAASG